MTKKRHPKAPSAASEGKPFVMLRHEMLDCFVWQQLTCAERCVYIALERRHNGRNNGHIVASVRDLATEARCNKDTVSRALRALERLGFLERMKAGAFSRTKSLATEYRLTAHPTYRKGAQERVNATNDFLSRSTVESNE